jgi:UDP-glucuronate decarboxylase
LTARKFTSVPRDLPQDDPGRRCPDISRAKRHLGFAPKVSLTAGFEATIADFKQRMS